MEPERSHRPATEMLELARPECLRLLAATGIGRIAVSVTEWDHPVIRPVNYVFDEPSQSVLIRSASGSKLHALLRSATAAFEIDGIDTARHVGWSVIIVGVAEEIIERSRGATNRTPRTRTLAAGPQRALDPHPHEHRLRPPHRARHRQHARLSSIATCLRDS